MSVWFMKLLGFHIIFASHDIIEGQLSTSPQNCILLLEKYLKIILAIVLLISMLK